VVLDDAGQSAGVVDVLYPGRELRVPHEGVSANKHAVGCSKVDEGIEATEVEVVLAGLNGIPLCR
jgi:hypothetical protein